MTDPWPSSPTYQRDAGGPGAWRGRRARTAISLAGVVLAGLLATGACALPPATAAPATLLISGAGDGHGVGLSQEGAFGLAEHGYPYRAILAHYYTGTSLATWPPGRTVRVLLATGRQRLTVTGAALVNGHRLSARASYAVSASGATLVLHSRGRGVRAARLLIVGHARLRVGGLAGAAPLAYRGALEVIAAGGGLEAINVVNVEDYVRGVVADESDPSWPAAALEAQAVASRTYALTSHASPGAGGFDVYADPRSQAYGGVAAESPSSDAAVAATAGQVVTYAGQPVVTYFFASSGGATENVENVFPGSPPEPWLRGVPDPYDTGPLHRWSRTLTFAAAAGDLSGLVKGSFEGIEVVKRGYSPRIVAAEVLGSGGVTPVSGDDLAGRFGLPATWASFSVSANGRTTPEPDLSGSPAVTPITPASPAPTVSPTSGGSTAPAPAGPTTTAAGGTTVAPG